MYTIIDKNPLFEDIRSQDAKNNLNMLVDYLCSQPVPEKREDELLHKNNYKELHESFAKRFYSPLNLAALNEILKNRTKFLYKNSCEVNLIDGYAWIYDLGKKDNLELGTMRFYTSIAVMEHELIHLLMAVNNNNPKAQHTEILSFFGELLCSLDLSQRYNNPCIYENHLINRCISRMSHRVKADNFSDEHIGAHSEWLFEVRCNAYPYMIGFIYASRLLNIYQENPPEVLSRVNEVLSGKITVEDLLNIYNISLTDDKTCNDFISLCDQYRSLIEERYDPSSVHYVI